MNTPHALRSRALSVRCLTTVVGVFLLGACDKGPATAACSAPDFVAMDPTTFAMREGTSTTLAAQLYDGCDRPQVAVWAWRSDNPAVAEVDSASGALVARRAGSVRIRARAIGTRAEGSMLVSISALAR